MFKVVSWNVNSITVRLPRLLKLIERHAPDVIALQELKCIEEKFPKEALEELGYHAAVFGQKTYNGVAILSKSPLETTRRGFEDGVEDPAARFIEATVNGVRILCGYIPNGQAVGSEKYAYKLQWLSRLKTYLETHHDGATPLLLMGDFNVAPHDQDVHNPELWRGKILFSEPEKEGLNRVLQFGLADTFRHLHPNDRAFSWWDYRQLAFVKNEGLRIDFIFATPKMLSHCLEAGIDREERKGVQPSDHAPVWANFEI